MPQTSKNSTKNRWRLFEATVSSILVAGVFSLTGCGGGSGESTGGVTPASEYESVELSDDEKASVIRSAQDMLGVPYEYGGQDRGGIDCSGLVVWAYNQQGVDLFRHQDEMVDDVTADSLYRFNVDRVDSLDQLERGDSIFFDENGDGEITHNAIFDRIDESGRVWVYDAYSVWGEVAYRYVEDFEDKGPLFGRPLKYVQKQSSDAG